MPLTAVGLLVWCVSSVLSIVRRLESAAGRRRLVSSNPAPFALLGSLVPLLVPRRRDPP